MYMLNVNPFIVKLKLIAITGLALVSCAMQKQKTQVNLSQGIEGYIYQTSGNQMPMKGKPVKHTGKGITRDVWIYQATTTQQTQGNIPLFTQIKSHLAAKVKSDSTGYYKCPLPAGHYSVFIKEGEQFFASETDGQGILNPVDVIAGNLTRRDINVNINAVY